MSSYLIPRLSHSRSGCEFEEAQNFKEVQNMATVSSSVVVGVYFFISGEFTLDTKIIKYVKKGDSDENTYLLSLYNLVKLT